MAETLASVFSCEFCEISKSTFFTEYFRTTASVTSFKKMKYVLCLNLIPCMVQELIFIQLFQRINKFHISFTFNRKQNPSYQLSLHSCTINKKNIFFSFSIFLNLFCFVILFVYLFVSINNVPLLVLKIMEHVPYLNLMNLFEIASFTS